MGSELFLELGAGIVRDEERVGAGSSLSRERERESREREREAKGMKGCWTGGLNFLILYVQLKGNFGGGSGPVGRRKSERDYEREAKGIR